ncbi:unnamed protein product [Calypogeia fissa]
MKGDTAGPIGSAGDENYGGGVEVKKETSESGSGSDTHHVKKRSRAERLGQELKKRYQLGSYHSVPEFMRDNDYIVGHYRVNLPFKQTLLSIFTIHNETLNIWTHLLGFFLFLGITIYTARQLPRVAENSLQNFSRLHSGWETIRDDLADIMAPRPKNPITRWPFFIFLVGAMFCLLASTACHLLGNYSKGLQSIMIRLDYAGIASLIASSFYPPIYYSFMCTPLLCNIYLTSITAMGVTTMLVSLLSFFQKSKFRSSRAALFFGMGISGVIPCVHKLLLHWDEPVAIKTFLLEAAMGSLYGLGALIYAVRIPERWKPGRFDILGSSHQIFHILVVAGALTHYRAGLLYLNWRDSQGCN